VSDTADDDAFAALTSKISRDRGFGAANYKGTCMRRRIAVRMRARGATDFASYSRLLDSDPAEYDWLIAALTVNVTKLFRNAEAWDAVAHSVLPALWSTPAPRLNCWVAGCASGEEAYTLAALWLQLEAGQARHARGDGPRARDGERHRS
jgi:chemotaxis methyl-accepting protein methylase